MSFSFSLIGRMCLAGAPAIKDSAANTLLPVTKEPAATNDPVPIVVWSRII